MTRFLLAAASLLLLVAVPGAQNPPRPDVLFIAVDDLNDWVGVLGGHPQARTPNIDALAARGMAFTNAHSPSALCNPSRTALLTGLRPSTTGVYDNGQDWRSMDVFGRAPTLPRYFREQGYRTLGAGKIFHAHTFGAGGFFGLNDPLGWDAFYPSVSRQLPDEVGPYTRPANGNPGFLGFDWSPVVADDNAMGDGQVVSWIERQMAAGTGAPRFVAAGIYRPHLPWYVPQAYLDLHPLDAIELPPVLDTDLDDVPPIARPGTQQSTQMHEWVLREGVWKNGVQAYLASVSFADAMVGRLMEALDRSGRADRTIVVLWGDHGFHLGEKGRWRKMTLWEESTRVPLVVVAPGVTTPGSRSAEAVSLMDLYPTLAELAGLEVPSHVEGQSLVPMLRDPGAVRVEPALTTYGYGNHAVRDEQYRYIRYRDGAEELYDHQADPNEWTNLAGRPGYDQVKAGLARWLPRVNVEPPRPAGRGARGGGRGGAAAGDGGPE
jgi:arylsulfatase A-like enzyme